MCGKHRYESLFRTRTNLNALSIILWNFGIFLFFVKKILKKRKSYTIYDKTCADPGVYHVVGDAKFIETNDKMKDFKENKL